MRRNGHPFFEQFVEDDEASVGCPDSGKHETLVIGPPLEALERLTK